MVVGHILGTLLWGQITPGPIVSRSDQRFSVNLAALLPFAERVHEGHPNDGLSMARGGSLYPAANCLAASSFAVGVTACYVDAREADRPIAEMPRRYHI